MIAPSAGVTIFHRGEFTQGGRALFWGMLWSGAMLMGGVTPRFQSPSRSAFRRSPWRESPARISVQSFDWFGAFIRFLQQEKRSPIESMSRTWARVRRET